MKLQNRKSPKKLFIQSFKVLFFFLFVAFAAANLTSAQRGNTDLPSGNPPQTKSTPPKKGPRRVAPRQPYKKPGVKATPTPSPTAPPSAAAKPQQSAAPSPVIAPPVAAAPVVLPVEPLQQIIERFSNFQQTASVTEKDWQSVVNQANAILKGEPGDEMTKGILFFAQGQLAFGRGDFSDALIQFNAAAEKMLDSPLPQYGRGLVYLNTKQPKTAEGAFERAIKIEKTFALAYKGLGDAASAQGKTKKADDYYKQASRLGLLNSGNVSAGQGNTPASGSVKSGNSSDGAPSIESPYDRDLKIARDYTAQRKWQMALDKLQPYVETIPSADLYIAIGDNYYGMKVWLSAEQAYKKATEANPKSALAFYKWGLVFFETNDFQAAANAFERALILDKDGTTINHLQTRKLADKAHEKVRGNNKSNKK